MKRTTFVITMLTTLFLPMAWTGRSHGQSPQPQPRPDLQLRWLHSLTLDKTNVIGGSVDGEITATLKLLRPAITNLSVSLFLEGAAPNEANVQVAAGALAPMSVNVMAGKSSATFPIYTFTNETLTRTRTLTLRAQYGDETVSTRFAVTPLQIASWTIVPAVGIGPFTAQATISLNARPATNQTVTVTSNHQAVGFGNVGNVQASTNVTFTSTNSLRTFQVVAGSVSQNTTVTLTAQFGAQTLTRQITVRPAF